MGEFLFSLCTIYFFGGGFRGNGRAWSRPSCRPAMASSRRSTSEMRCSGLSCQPKTASAEHREGGGDSFFFFMRRDRDLQALRVHARELPHPHPSCCTVAGIHIIKQRERAQRRKNARFRGTSRTRTSISSPVIINASRVVGGF